MWTICPPWMYTTNNSISGYCRSAAVTTLKPESLLKNLHLLLPNDGRIHRLELNLKEDIDTNSYIHIYSGSYSRNMTG